MAKLNDIEAFLSPGKIAMAGVSRNPKKFSRTIFKNLKKKNLQLVPINPNMDDIDGDKCYKSVAELPTDIKKLLVTTPKANTETIVKEAIEKGIEIIWIQQGSNTEAAFNVAEESDMKVINNVCILMHAKPVKGIHGFHSFLAKLFGAFPTN